MIKAAELDRVLVRVPGRDEWYPGTVVVSVNEGESLGLVMDKVFTFPVVVAGVTGCFATQMLVLEYIQGDYREISNGQVLEIRRDDSGEVAQSA